MYRFDQLIERFELIEERMDARLRAVEDKLLATLDVTKEKTFIQACINKVLNKLILFLFISI